MIHRCDVVAQYEMLSEEIHAAIRRVLKSGRYVLGDECRAFEGEFCEYLGIEHGVSVASATDGLTLSLMARDIGNGDEVITTPFTAIPTVAAIVASGATPVFVDIDGDSFLMDVARVGSAITARTKAVVPVHIFGNVFDVPALRDVVGPDIAIIEDAAQAHGSRLGSSHAGTMDDIGVFSFYPTKNLGGYGDGGMVVMANRDLADRLRLLRNYGMVDKDHTITAGLNSRLDELQAAILRVKLKHLDEFNANRNRCARLYVRKLDETRFTHQRVADEVCSNDHVFAVRFRGDRVRLIKDLDEQGIQTNIYYLLPLHLQESLAYLGYRQGDYEVAESLCREVLALPMYSELSEATQDQVISAVNQAGRQATASGARQ